MSDLAALPRDMEWRADGHAFGSVGWLVPFSDSYDYFTRIFHSRTGGGASVNWKSLARERGVRWHAEIQFSELAGMGENAWLGTLDASSLRSLAQDLDKSGTDPSCILALWDGNQWITPPSLSYPGIALVRQEIWDRAGRLQGPYPTQRTYKILSAVLSTAIVTGVMQVPGLVEVRQPTVFWDTDRRFCVATDTDYDSTIVASDYSTQSRILRDTDLQALPIQAENSLLSR